MAEFEVNFGTKSSAKYHSYIRPTRTRPLVVKLHGDYRLSPQNTAQETARLKKTVENQVRVLLQDRGLIFIGYGGNDKGIQRTLEALPIEALPLGIFWVSGNEPDNIMRSWLELRNAIWVKMGDFDKLMLLVRDEFALPNPSPERFEQVFLCYHNKYNDLSQDIRSLPDTAADAQVLKEALDRTDQSLAPIISSIRASHLSVTSWIGDENGHISLPNFIEGISHYVQLKNYAMYHSNITIDSHILGKGITYRDSETQWHYVGEIQAKSRLTTNELTISQPIIIDPTHEVGTVRFKVDISIKDLWNPNASSHFGIISLTV